MRQKALSASLRERDAEYAEYAAISSDSVVHFVSAVSSLAADDISRFVAAVAAAAVMPKGDFVAEHRQRLKPLPE